MNITSVVSIAGVPSLRLHIIDVYYLTVVPMDGLTLYWTAGVGPSLVDVPFERLQEGAVPWISILLELAGREAETRHLLDLKTRDKEDPPTQVHEERRDIFEYAAARLRTKLAANQKVYDRAHEMVTRAIARESA